jgi:hypothetical protein
VRITLVLVLATSLAVTGACGQSSSRTPAVVRDPPPAAGPSLADPLALLPAASDVVIKVDVAAMRNSALFTRYRGMVRDFIVPGFADCQYDPFDDIDTLTAGIPMGAALGVFVVRGLDRDKTLRCLRTSKIETQTEAAFDGDVVTLRNKSGNTNLMVFVDARTAVIQGSKGPTKDTLANALRIGAPLREDKAFLAAEARLKPGAVFSAVARPGSPALTQQLTQQVGATVRGFTMTVHSTDVITGRITIEMAEASMAEAVLENVQPQLAELRQLVERYDVRADGSMVIVDLVITEAQIKMFADLAKSLRKS